MKFNGHSLNSKRKKDDYLVAQKNILIKLNTGFLQALQNKNTAIIGRIMVAKIRE